MVLRCLTHCFPLSLTGLSPSPVGLSSAVLLAYSLLSVRSCNPTGLSRWFRLLRFRSPLLAESFLFLRVLRCFSSPGSLRLAMCSPAGDAGLPRAGFPHSDIAGSPSAHDSPTLFAVCHVLLRPLTPRHPPSAFCRLSTSAETATAFGFFLPLAWVGLSSDRPP